VVFLALLALSCGACRAKHTDSIAIIHVSVIAMTGEMNGDKAATPALADQTVVIEKDRVAAIGPSSSTEIPSGARVLDGSGKFLIPGLADMHVHLTAAGEPDGSRKFMLPLLVAHGITTVRDMGGYLESLEPLRKEIASGVRVGPQISTPGPYLDGAPPSFQPSLVVTNNAEANDDVRQLVRRGVDFVKVQSMLNRDAYFAIADAAKREHIPFAGHVPDRVTAMEAAGAGQRSIEHLTNILRACAADEPALMRQQFYVPSRKESAAQAHARVVRWQQKMLAAYSDGQTAALLAKFRENEVWQTPTLILLQNDAFPTLDNLSGRDSRTEFIPGKTLEVWKQGRAQQMRFVAVESQLRAQLFARSQAVVAQMQGSRVRLLAGTDSPAPYVFPGSSLHEELALLVEAGLTPMQALQAATRSAAEFLRSERGSGTIEAGKYADLVLLDADPLSDIHNTRKIRAVLVRGKLLDRAQLDLMLDAARSFAAIN
jgi:imidazolonepropionase-like amidohydrolase